MTEVLSLLAEINQRVADADIEGFDLSSLGEVKPDETAVGKLSSENLRLFIAMRTFGEEVIVARDALIKEFDDDADAAPKERVDELTFNFHVLDCMKDFFWLSLRKEFRLFGVSAGIRNGGDVISFESSPILELRGTLIPIGEDGSPMDGLLGAILSGGQRPESM